MGFNVGDKVISHAPVSVYMVTHEGWTGYVTDVFDEDKIRVNKTFEPGRGYPVISEYFENLSVPVEPLEAISADDLMRMVFGDNQN